MAKRVARGAGVTVLALIGGLAACDQPGPLSAAAKRQLAPPPAAPAWAAPLAGKALKSVFPAEARCVGYVDAVTDRFKDARKAVGWSWSVTHSQAVQRLVAVDAAGAMVGFGEGGTARPDVPAVRPEVGSPDTGWWLITPTAERSYAVWGVDAASGSACPIGEVKPYAR
jgi:hypothetical protein